MVPVLYIVFNRLDTVRQSFAAIRNARPEKLYIAADGPRHAVPTDMAQCEAVRKYVLEKIDWPCSIQTCFREKNLGCGPGVAAAISWFFNHVEEGIVLEDDCVAAPAFFEFAETLLERYRCDDRITHISGNCFVPRRPKGRENYFFCRYPFSWGWATWRRAWRYFDFELSSFPEFEQENCLADLFPRKHRIQRRFLEIFRATYRHNPNFSVWDFQWMYMHFRRHTLTICPSRNLVMNIGSEGTHKMHPWLLNQPVGEPFDPVAPEFMIPDIDFEDRIFDALYAQSPLWCRALGKLNRLFRNRHG